MNTEMTDWRDAMTEMRKRFEVAGGVPYLMRDEAFIARLGHPTVKLAWSDHVKRWLQHEWNQGIALTAAGLNGLLARRW
ncbi:hypothetical protein DFQ28_000338 [Apophysomyces sp. BC1034]|nr:hypothetical protein DFQ30_002947 [Apophysomyces sp. BC1015]KAG0180842.1 hypothetical protein DFQ29_009981 [Apophysomyces sp. BC1021]KAG0191381.1 hypothetical protein DFQ28_000338 [Apophysomyces sp. BC1034]